MKKKKIVKKLVSKIPYAKIILTVVKIFIYPIYVLIDEILFSSEDTSQLKTAIRRCVRVVLSVVWTVVFIELIDLHSIVFNHEEMFATTTALIGSGNFNTTGAGAGISSGGDSSGNNNGVVTVNGLGNNSGVMYQIDLNNLPQDVNMPSGSFSSGTTKMRAELYLLTAEACAQSGVNCEPWEILGIMYNESNCNLSLKSGNDLFDGLSSEADPANCDYGPFQMRTDQFWNTGDKGGYTVNSAYDPKGGGQFSATKYNGGRHTDSRGINRPDMNYYPDAIYTCAMMLTNCKARTSSFKIGTDYFDEVYSKFSFDAKKKNEGEYLRFCGIHNSWGSGFVPYAGPFYLEVIDKKGTIGYNYKSLPLNRSAYADELKELSKSFTPRRLEQIPSSYYSYQGSHEYIHGWEVNKVSMQYTAIAVNGGMKVWDDLQTLASIVGTPVQTSDDNSGGSTGGGSSTSGGTSTGNSELKTVDDIKKFDSRFSNLKFDNGKGKPNLKLVANALINYRDYPGGSKYRKHMHGYDNGEAWCADFVSTNLDEVGYPKPPSRSSSCEVLKSSFKSIGKFALASEYTPKAGDIILLWNDSGGYHHTGIVVGVKPNGDVVTVEGNTGSGDGKTGIVTYTKSTNYHMSWGQTLKAYCIVDG